jgi:hypothetical protein
MKASAAHCRRGYFFFLDKKEAKNQVRADAAPPALPVLNAFSLGTSLRSVPIGKS